MIVMSDARTISVLQEHIWHLLSHQNDDRRGCHNLDHSDGSRVVIYDSIMFIEQATGVSVTEWIFSGEEKKTFMTLTSGQPTIWNLNPTFGRKIENHFDKNQILLFQLRLSILVLMSKAVKLFWRNLHIEQTLETEEKVYHWKTL